MIDEKNLNENAVNMQCKYIAMNCGRDCANCWKFELIKPRWIPCSEKLPEATGEYLLQNEDDEIFIGNFDKECGDYGEFGEWQDWYDPMTLGFVDTDFVEYTTIIAWMPLPPAYK